MDEGCGCLAGIAVVAVVVGAAIGWVLHDDPAEADELATQREIAEEVCRPMVQEALDRADDNESEIEDLRSRTDENESAIEDLRSREYR